MSYLSMYGFNNTKSIALDYKRLDWNVNASVFLLHCDVVENNPIRDTAPFGGTDGN